MRVGLVPAAYFEVLQVKPMMGRLFTAEENQEGKNFVAAISAQLWRSRFGADPSILGRPLRINGEPYTIVAVIPDLAPEWVEAGRLDAMEIWTPFAFPEVWAESARGDRGYLALGRMKPGVTVAQAQADLTVVADALGAEHPVDQGVSVVLKKLGDTRAGSLRPMLFLLMGAVGLILLMACVNLANLLLVRNSARQRELALRAALGSARGGLIRQLLVEPCCCRCSAPRPDCCSPRRRWSALPKCGSTHYRSSRRSESTGGCWRLRWPFRWRRLRCLVWRRRLPARG
jgi:putative ABC transport system permease protein